MEPTLSDELRETLFSCGSSTKQSVSKNQSERILVAWILYNGSWDGITVGCERVELRKSADPFARLSQGKIFAIN